MTQASLVVGKVARVEGPAAARRVEAAAQASVRLADGTQVRLDAGDARTGKYLGLLGRAQEHGIQVALEVDASRTMRALYLPSEGRVRSAGAGPDGSVIVALDGDSGCYALAASHPRFAQLRQTLEGAAAARGRVLLVDDHARRIVDVQVLDGGLPAPPPGVRRDVQAGVPSPAHQQWRIGQFSVAGAFDLLREMSGLRSDPANPAADSIPFNYPDGGCWVRAQAMCRVLRQRRLPAGIVWLLPYDAAVMYIPQSKPSLRAITRNLPDKWPGYEVPAAWWFWHCAPVIMVKHRENDYRPYVIDPSIQLNDNDPSVTLQEWIDTVQQPGEKPETFPYFTEGNVFNIRDASPQSASNLLFDDENYSETNRLLAYYQDKLHHRWIETRGPPYPQWAGPAA